MRFQELNLIPALLQALEEEGYEKATPIQMRAIEPILEGRDLMGCAQTGTGKTAAFALPILQRMHAAGVPQGRRKIRTLVLAPTRELASQIAESFRNYGRHLHLRTAVVFGGVGQRPQEQELSKGIDILVACPGRLLDLIGQGHCDLSSVQVLVLDEADRMLDMGFLPDLKRIVARVGSPRQTLLFSATMPDEIAGLANSWMHNPVHIEVAAVSSAAETVVQSIRRVTKEEKLATLEDILLERSGGRVLVFSRTKHGADRIVKRLDKAGIEAAAIHGDKSQGARERALRGFRDGSVPVLVASDIAARGLDIDEIRLVVNYDLPPDPETYVHRIGRTGRAGAEGEAISFVTPEDRDSLRLIERTIQRTLSSVGPDLSDEPRAAAPLRPPQPRPQPKTQQQGGRQQQGAKPQTQQNGQRNNQKGRPPQARDGRSPAPENGNGNGNGKRRQQRRRGKSQNAPANPQQAQPGAPSFLGKLWRKLGGN